jgi:hypothetical protein
MEIVEDDNEARTALVEEMCHASHDAYEQAASLAGWATNQASRVPWGEVPEANKVAVRAAMDAALDVAIREFE